MLEIKETSEPKKFDITLKRSEWEKLRPTIKELQAEGAKFTNHGAISKTSTKDVVTFDDYLDDTTVTKFKDVPSWKRMCVCIIKNDYSCKYMGFAKNKTEQEKRKRALAKYANL